MRNLGTGFYPVVNSLPASGGQGQHVTLTTDGRDYYWDVNAAAWVTITPLRKIDSFAFDGSSLGPFVLTFTPITGRELKAFVDEGFVNPTLYSIPAGTKNFSLTSVNPPYATPTSKLYVAYDY